MPAAVWVPALIAGGSSVAGSAIASHGNTEAAKTQAASSDKSLAQAKEIYEQQRADLSPYRELGYSSLGALAQGMGLPAPSNPITNPPAPSYANGAPPPTGEPFSTMSLSQLHGLANSGSPNAPVFGQLEQKMNQVSGTMKKVKAPNGQVYTIPVTRLPEALQQGGQVVG